MEESRGRGSSQRKPEPTRIVFLPCKSAFNYVLVAESTVDVASL
jgi:hypothetical protein